MNRLSQTSVFEIESFGNGFAFRVVRKIDGRTVFLQGEDALRLDQELERTTNSYCDDDVASEYFV